METNDSKQPLDGGMDSISDLAKAYGARWAHMTVERGGLQDVVALSETELSEMLAIAFDRGRIECEAKHARK